MEHSMPQETKEFLSKIKVLFPTHAENTLRMAAGLYGITYIQLEASLKEQKEGVND